MQSKKYSWNKEEGMKILKVALYTGASTAIASLITMLQDLNVPPEYMFLVGGINLLLVIAKKFFDGK